MIVITDERIHPSAISALKRHGFEAILLPPDDHLAPPVSCHTDMIIFMGFGRLFCHENYYRGNKELIDRISALTGKKLVLSRERIGAKYPFDVLFNACVVGKKLICNTKTVSRLILNAATEEGYQIIDVPQGYTKCSVCVVSEDAIITADRAIARACEGIVDTLTIQEGHISLPPYGYGFIGGTSGLHGDKVFFCGDLSTHPSGALIKDFCKKHGKDAISLCDGELFDVGSLFFIGEKNKAMNKDKMDKSYWNEKYWVRHMACDDLDHVEDPWIEEYESVFMSHKGKLLDLGCGIGQYSAYFASKGFQVVAGDISERALTFLTEKRPEIATVKLDMTEPLPFADGSFDVVFANLSIHFFSESDTKALIKEIKRILKSGGIFIGSCNSSKAYKYIESSSTVIEPGFYMEDGGRSVRLFDEAQFNFFFSDLQKILLEEVETVRFNKSKNMWKFIYGKV